MEVNNSIKCGVHDCKHHAGNVEYLYLKLCQHRRLRMFP